MHISIFQSLLFENEVQHFFSIFLPVFMEVFIFLSRPDTSNSRVYFSTDGSSRPDRIVTIRRDICSFPGSSTSGSKAYFLFKLHDPTSGESGRQRQLTTRLSSCILDMCDLTYDFFFEAVFTIPIILQVLQYSANIIAF